MPGIFSWYNNQYASWNRMRRMQAPPYVARVDTRTSRTATAMHSGTEASVGDVVINMGEIASPNAPGKDNKDTLFGPSIGVVGTAPEWCAADATLDEKVFSSEKELNEKDDDETDELTPEIVKEWVRRSNEPSEPTTTLQALVNLKRPSIRLSPLAASSPEPSASDHDISADAHAKHNQQHGVEFEFDCDASQCAISLHVVGVPAHLGVSDDHNKSTIDVSAPADGKEIDRLLLFEATLPGGFARKLTLAEGAVLELARLEAAARAHRAHLAATVASAANANASAQASTVNVSSGTQTPDHHHKKRLMFFRKKLNSHSQPSVSGSQPTPAIPTGPSLAVVDAEASPHPHHQGTLSEQSANTLATFFAGGDAERARRKKEADEEGVRVAIRLSARDADGRPLKVRNEQVTYLHIVRQGPVLASQAEGSHSTNTDGSNNEQQTQGQEGREEERNAEDSRPWVVRVVKREARIGAHSFQLHEIYGLTAHASASEAAHTVSPSSPSAPSVSHTYPPLPPQPQIINGGTAAELDESPAECLLCLSAAREVVLLPCRHLVACRECAINMVEFGAGGTVAQPEAEAPSTITPAADANAPAGETPTDGATTGPAEAASPAPAAAPTPTPAARRKRKAKGWFCPVCRQPYTSLLRITTVPPAPKSSGLEHSTSDGSPDAKRVSLTSSIDGDSTPSPVDGQQQQLEAAHPLANTPNLGVTESPPENDNGAPESRGGTFGSLGRPGFLRHLSGLSGRSAGPGTTGRERDLERGA